MDEAVAPAPDDEADGDDDEEVGEDDDDGTPEGQDQTQDQTRVVGPASGPPPPRTVWEAFAVVGREETDGEGDDDAA